MSVNVHDKVFVLTAHKQKCMPTPLHQRAVTWPSLDQVYTPRLINCYLNNGVHPSHCHTRSPEPIQS